MMKAAKPAAITLDGPAASGKSTVGSLVAQALGYLFFDTGLMYRAVTWAALQQGIDINNEAQICALTEASLIDVRPASQEDGRTCDVFINDDDITLHLRRPEVDANVSIVAAYHGVRVALSRQQRRIGQRGRILMVGRDIGTVVLPEADLKIYLDASAEERARRRYNEIIDRGETADYDQILEKVRQRDHIDSTRDIAPLRPAEDAVIIDSSRLDIDQVVEQILARCT